LHVAWACGSAGAGHGVQLVPQELTLVSETQELLQACVPEAQSEHTFEAQ
jgi:hypothetical protein